TLHGQAPTGLAALGNGLLMFVVEAGGGLLVGALAGFLISHILRRIDDPVVETTITLVSAYGIYWIADMLQLSDASGRDYRGHIDSLGGATGSRFSLLPPENATGNYVKVVQRVPVRIVLEQGENDDHRLRPGMSVEPKVRLR
ncbi:MAG TPA: cation:proton antiporter, partial [Candidatus Binatia bacterium]|nr:cation:proton antiporter [Candidatus Binatia bacterium]